MPGNITRLPVILICLLMCCCFLPNPNDSWAGSRPAGNFNKISPDVKRQKGLAQRRDQAAVKGLQWLDAFLDKDDHFKTMPFEAYQFFYVCSLTSANYQFQRKAQKASDKYAIRLKNHCLNLRDPMERYDFLQLLEFLSKRENSHIDYTALLDKAKNNYMLYKRTADIYGTPIENLKQADWKGVYETLLYAYFLEKADAEFPNVFPVDFRLTDILLFLKNKNYIHFADDPSENKQRAVQDAFLVTHMAYMLGNYSQLRLYERDAPWLYKYLRRNFDDILAMDHLDLIGECVDIFRSLGYTEENCEIVRKGTAYLLARQNADGSWGKNNQEDSSAYDKMHPTSCAVWALRTRTFLADTKYDRRIRRIVQELNRVGENHALASPSFVHLNHP